jgi:threonine/homoserine/homoserine lactone efflux protein
MAPGPNNLLSINNATHYGFWASCIAGTGRLIAFAGMIALAAAGLAVVLEASELVFHGVKALGAAYLFYLSIKLWNAKTQTQETNQTETRNIASLAKQEFLIAAGNPKAILIFTAFLPQFINPTQDVAPQFALLGSLFLILEMIALAGYALIGLHLRRWINEPKGKRLFNRTCAVLLSGAASVLLATRRA